MGTVVNGTYLQRAAIEIDFTTMTDRLSRNELQGNKL